ncbi:hypothetical protein F5050DRAFT_1751407 [Lentinula boryana]|uniref:Uncharacterized protein n=1 Tax=Lentinula boryana TaxID=40481 RepID=A0ABQ8QG20_9AGAR|nr:hypothetical protein F5050DRAFT_1751407 [Lentinula boryana]
MHHLSDCKISLFTHSFSFLCATSFLSIVIHIVVTCVLWYLSVSAVYLPVLCVLLSPWCMIH